MQRRNQIRWAALLMLLLLTLGGARRGYAGAEGPPGIETIPKSKMNGEFVALHEPTTGNVAFLIIGTCKGGHQFTIGPLFAPDFPVPFEVATSEAGLVGFLILKSELPELIHVPAECFPDDEVVGFVVDKIVRYIAQTPTVVIARVVLLGIRQETP